jgi:hypothetical protein
MGWGLQKMTTEKQVTVADGCTPKPIEVVVVEAVDSDVQGLYVNGQLRESESVIYPSEISKHVGTNLMVLTVADVVGYFTDKPLDWPEFYSDLVPYIETSEGF